MKKYINPFVIANTVRMTNLRRDSQTALVERDSDVRLIDARIDWYGYHAIPAHSLENLVGAVEILAEDGWGIACVSVTGAEQMPEDSPAPLRRFPWLSGTWEEIAENARGLSGGRFCLAVLPVDADEPAELSSNRDNEAVPSRSRGRGGMSEAWARRNTRRVFLIRKRLQQGLADEEQEELDRLQSEMSRRLNAAFPLPFDALDRLEDYVDQAERRLSDR